MDIFVVTGLVREKESGVGLPGLIVRAYDKDAIYDDLMGEARTGCDGGFCINSEAKDFRDFLDVRPDIYLRVLCPGPAGTAPRESRTRSPVSCRATKGMGTITITDTIMEDTIMGGTNMEGQVAVTSITSPASAPPSPGAVTSISRSRSSLPTARWRRTTADSGRIAGVFDLPWRQRVRVGK